ncbi:MAG TPA: hypothetical protein VE344_07485 [Methylomirabilota bacterium]|nr:hypothetical protein [Methylomirabilota bacterium]
MNKSRQGGRRRDYAGVPRVMLHARKKEMTFEAPLPKDFRDALKFLRLTKSTKR